MLESAWDTAQGQSQGLLATLKASEVATTNEASIAVQSQSNNGHSASGFFPGTNAPTSSEMARGWRMLIDRFRETSLYLKTCARYGLDAFQIKGIGYFPSTLPSQVANPINLDTTGNWAQLVDKFSIDTITTDLVIGCAIEDPAIWLWMMDNLNAVTESRGDYSAAIIGRGGSWL